MIGFWVTEGVSVPVVGKAEVSEALFADVAGLDGVPPPPPPPPPPAGEMTAGGFTAGLVEELAGGITATAALETVIRTGSEVLVFPAVSRAVAVRV